MNDRDEAVRVAVYRGLAETGRLPALDELAAQTALAPSEVAESLEALAAARHVVFDRDHRIVLAHPFATRNFAFSVMGSGRCGGAGAHGTRSPSRTSCPTSRPRSSPRPARRAGRRTRGP